MKIVPTRLASIQEHTYFVMSICVKDKMPLSIAHPNENACIQTAAFWLYKNSPLKIKNGESEFIGNVTHKHETIASLNTDPMCEWIGVSFSIKEKPVLRH